MLGRKIARHLKQSAIPTEDLHVWIRAADSTGETRQSVLDSVAQAVHQYLDPGQVTIAYAPQEVRNAQVSVTVSVIVDDRRQANWGPSSRPAESPAPHVAEQPAEAPPPVAEAMPVVQQAEKPAPTTGATDGPMGEMMTATQDSLIASGHLAVAEADSAAAVEQVAGRVEADVRLPDSQVRMSVRFVDKPWVGGFAEFCSTSARRHFLLAKSSDLASSPHEARAQALRAAAAQLAPRVREQLGSYPSRRAVRPETIQHDLLATLGKGQYIVDEFAQELQTGAGGAVWRHAFLLEFTPADVQEASWRQVSHHAAVRSHRISTLAAFAGLTVLACVLYLFLNAATKGYYREALLGAALALVLIGGMALILV